MDNSNDPIEDAEIVEETSAVTPQQTPSSAVSDRLNLETMINRYVGDIEKMREQLKTQKEMFDDAFNNDPTYAEQDEKVKAETRKRTEIKQKILKQPAVADLFSKLKHIRDEIKDTQDTLSQLLQQYYESTGTVQITGDDGEIREIVFVRKLVKKNSKFKP